VRARPKGFRFKLPPVGEAIAKRSVGGEE